MTWPFENNTNGIVKNLAKRNLKSEKRRNVMVIVSVVLAAFLISLSGLTGVSLMQTERIIYRSQSSEWCKTNNNNYQSSGV